MPIFAYKKSRQSLCFGGFFEFGGAYRDRTDDLNAASVALSQLS